jgi:ribonuclease BN (tRNA processing enzyme)
MKLTVLGSGTLVPSGTRNSAGYFVELPSARLMLDCGAGSVHALARFGVPWQSMSHIFISHFHVDHVGDLAALFYALKYEAGDRRRDPLTIIGPRGLTDVMNGLSKAFGSRLFEPRFPLHVKMLEPNQQLQLGNDCYLSVAKTPHTKESLAVRIQGFGRSLCYTGDTAFSENLARFFKETDLLISECSFRERQVNSPHLSIKDAAMLASMADSAQLLLTHFYFDVDEDELKTEIRKDYSGQVLIGKDGMRVEL